MTAPAKILVARCLTCDFRLSESDDVITAKVYWEVVLHALLSDPRHDIQIVHESPSEEEGSAND